MILLDGVGFENCNVIHAVPKAKSALWPQDRAMPEPRQGLPLQPLSDGDLEHVTMSLFVPTTADQHVCILSLGLSVDRLYATFYRCLLLDRPRGSPSLHAEAAGFMLTISHGNQHLGGR